MRGKIFSHRTLWLLHTCYGLDHTIKYQLSSSASSVESQTEDDWAKASEGRLTNERSPSLFVWMHRLLAMGEYTLHIMHRALRLLVHAARHWACYCGIFAHSHLEFSNLSVSRHLILVFIDFIFIISLEETVNRKRKGILGHFPCFFQNWVFSQKQEEGNALGKSEPKNSLEMPRSIKHGEKMEWPPCYKACSESGTKYTLKTISPSGLKLHVLTE